MKLKVFLINFALVLGVVQCNRWNGVCDFKDTVNITGGYKDGKGNYLHNGIIYSPGTFASINLILNRENELIPTAQHVRGCICLYKPCLRFCCAENECIKDNSFMLTTEDDNEVLIDLNGGDYGVLMGRPCKEMYELLPEDYEDDQWSFVSNGSLKSVSSHKFFDTNDYCFNQTEDDNTSIVTTNVFLCYNPTPEDSRLKWYPYGMMFSIPFLIITFCIYGFIPKLKNLHGQCLMCYIFGLTLLYIFLSTIQFNPTFLFANSFACRLIGFLALFSLLLCFFWLNIMSYDIWRTYERGVAVKAYEEERKTFLIYCLYGFGVPSMFTLIVYLIDFTQLLSHRFQPKIGIKRCWIEDSRLIEAIYVYIPISIIVLINIALFLLTANKIRQANNIDVNGAPNTRTNTAKYRYVVYLQLFILMGIFWCMESISWIFDNSFFVFYITDFINCIQGFLIFLICVMKKRTRKLVIEKFCHRSERSAVDSGYNESSGKTSDMQF